ncbi:DUF3515 domain-containing protein [Streptomyces sp. ET3-23]|uniref:DUF3515 domain-containing protein n=1 Tax=Streptomyces sp. ET3-23 TaxID=2885643 RepID=UPI001D104B06|nr:DUF3515 domain-containing protein [Streptomyces sp. ET3-23]MCC2279767.1 DUF3515 domain-containing protein [Streptomyces sp. ET3-23]
MKSRRKWIVLAAAAVAAASVAAVLFWPGAGDGEIEAAPYSGNPACEKVVAKLPADLLGKSRHDTGVRGTAAWGGEAVVLRCGVTPPLPTTMRCVSVNGVDWVIDEARAERDGVRSVTTYGRRPAVEVTFFGASESAGDGLVDLTDSVKGIPQTAHCM